MNPQKLKNAFLFCAATAAACAAADTFWTAGSESGTKYWDDAANWYGSGGNYVVNMGGNPETEINFRKAGFDSIGSGMWIENTLAGVVTFKADSPDCGLKMTQTDLGMHVGGWGNPGALTVDGGTYHFMNDLLVGYDRNVGRFVLKNGRVQVSYWLPMAAGDNVPADQTSEVVVEGGELIVGWRDGAYADNARIEVPRTAGKKAAFLQTGGLVSVNGSGGRSLSIGEGAGSTGTYTISNGTFIARSEEVSVAQGANSTGALNLHGGVFNAPAIKAGDGAATVDFDGGTFAPSRTGDVLPASGNLTVNLGENGGTIDTRFNCTVSTPFAGTGSLAKRGPGILALSGAVADGTFIVEEGAAVIPEGISISRLALAAGATLFIDGENAKTAASVEELKALVNVTEWDIAEGASINGWTAGERGADLDTPVETQWILPAGASGLYDEPSNWSRGVPTAIDTIVFVADADVCTSGDSNGRSFQSIEIRNGATVWFHTLQQDKFPQFAFASVSGTGTLGFNRCGFAPSGNGVVLTIPETVELVFANDIGASSVYDAWIQKGAGDVIVNGNVTIENYLLIWGGVTFNGTVTMKNGSRLNGNGSTIKLGEDFKIVVPEGATATVDGNWVNTESVFPKEGAGTLLVNHTGYGELVLREGVATLASNEGPSHKFSFQGGTLRIAYAMNWFDELVNRVNSSQSHTDAIKIDTRLDVAFNTALGSENTTHGFVKLGGNALTLSKSPRYTGDTRIEEGTLVLACGVSLPGELSIADGAKIKIALDPSVWIAGYSGTLFEYGSLADGLVLGENNVIIEGLADENEMTLDFSEAGKVTASVSGEMLVWKGADGAEWSGAGNWKSSSNGNDAQYADGLDLAFNSSDMADGEPQTKTVGVDAEVSAGRLFAAVREGCAYRFEGTGLSAAGLEKSGDGAVVLANDSLAVNGLVNIKAGEIVLEGATFDSTEYMLNSGTIRASGEGKVSAINQFAYGTGSYTIDEGATLQLGKEQILPMPVTGAGTLMPMGVWLAVDDMNRFRDFTGTIYIGPGSTLNLEEGSAAKYEHYIAGANTTIVMAGGTIPWFGGPKGSHGNDAWLGGSLVFETGTTSTINNLQSRNGAGLALRVNSRIMGGGTVNFNASSQSGWATDFNGDGTGFTGVMNLSGEKFRFTTAHAASADAVYNLTSANNFDMLHAGGTELRFGALNVTQSGANIYVGNSGAIIEIGNKADSTIEGAFIGEEFTLNKVGDTSLLLNGGAAMANVAVNGGAFGGTGTVKSLALVDGAEIAFSGLDPKAAEEVVGLKVLSGPQWSKRPAIRQAVDPRGKWVLAVRRATIQPEGADAYDEYTLVAVYRKGGFAFTLR